MNRNIRIGNMRYIKREVRDENALLTEESLKDLGWECTGREKLGAGKSALYFRRSREEEKGDAALQRAPRHICSSRDLSACSWEVSCSRAVSRARGWRRCCWREFRRRRASGRKAGRTRARAASRKNSKI